MLQTATRWCYIPESEQRLALEPSRGRLGQLQALGKLHGMFRSEKAGAGGGGGLTLPEK